MKLSVLVPVFNERRTIKKVIDRVLAVDLGDLEREVILVDDGSTDGSREVLASLEDPPQVRVYYHDLNQGKGAAVRTAMFRATGDIMLVQDADLEYDPRDYHIVLQPILEGRADVVYGSRFMGAPRKAMLFWHMVGNHFLTLLTNVLYDSIISDMETCYKAFRADVIHDVVLRAKKFELEPELTAKILKRGYRIYEVPISYDGREYTEGKKITWRDGPDAAWTLLRYRFRD
ncbi:MAG: glycosyltransferase family 2 protein [Anaerolineae bacterium]|nr:glycosyltransferase family 2 protein [Anaerolineae bacterium]